VKEQSCRSWAYEEFGSADLGDLRREHRLLRVAAVAAARPSGRVTEVFRDGAQRQGAYDLLENEQVRSDAIAAAMFRATAKRSGAAPFAYVVVDGSSLKLSDPKRSKDFGGIGSTQSGARGLKVISAYALDSRGVPLGLLDQQWWARAMCKKRNDHQKRPLEQKETKHWVSCVANAGERLKEAGNVRPWFLVDREGDCLDLLTELQKSGALFTIRSRHNRRLRCEGDDRAYLVDQLGAQRPIGFHIVDVPDGYRRTARKARLAIRVIRTTVRVRDRRTDLIRYFDVGCVDAREESAVPKGEKPLHWRLLTNAKIGSLCEAERVVSSYVQRWKIEDFHRAWKSGACNVERCQLRKKEHAVKWATLMAAVAARIERLKHLARTEPERPADSEFSAHQLQALILMKRKYKKRTETISDDVPSIAAAVMWLAELGGYTGKSSGGPPGATTIRRGLDLITPVAEAIQMLEEQGKLR